LAQGQKVFGRYTLTGLVGRGGMGVVWKAQDDKLQRETALKFIPEEVRLDPVGIEELKGETRRSLEVTHPHIVRIYDFVDDDQMAAISMEYIQGASLAKLRSTRKPMVFRVEEIAEWMLQLCEALHHAHTDANLAHRDIKPANLLITSRNQLKVVDFGIARHLRNSLNRVTKDAGNSGTLVYMSPQQLQGDPPIASDDLYSVGATIYELLTGQTPFHSGDIPAQIMGKVPPRMAERRRQFGLTNLDTIPEAWETAVAACLAKDPAARPASARALKEMLEGKSQTAAGTGTASGKTVVQEGGAGTTVQAKDPAPTGGVAPTVEPTPRPWLKWVGLAAGVLLVIGGGAWLLRSPGKASGGGTVPPQPTNEVKSKVVVQPPKDPDALPPVPSGERRTSSLGIIFLPLPKTSTLMAATETRVIDFRLFAQATKLSAPKSMAVLTAKGWAYETGRSWENPGFPQGANHPVVGVSWDEAKAFCEWFTRKDQSEKKLGANERYDLPTDEEWSLAMGMVDEVGAYPDEKAGSHPKLYVWRGTWPPSKGAGNLAGEESKTADVPANWTVIPGYRDDFPRTSPIGSFGANWLGISDLSGNVWEWTEDWYNGERKTRVLRGGAWDTSGASSLLASYREPSPPNARVANVGFRCVLRTAR
jgi:formylglycine-generating enzyme required for sulfatase activity